MCASVHLLKVLWQHHLLNIDAQPKQVFLQGLPQGLQVHAFVCLYALIFDALISLSCNSDNFVYMLQLVDNDLKKDNI